KQIGLNQVDFARRLGVKQSALSMMESGRMAVSADRMVVLRREFAGSAISLSFQQFEKELKLRQGIAHPALTSPMAGYLTLPIWRWVTGFDLGRMPSEGQTVGLV